jgi:hypothetical protein
LLLINLAAEIYAYLWSDYLRLLILLSSVTNF